MQSGNSAAAPRWNDYDRECRLSVGDSWHMGAHVLHRAKGLVAEVEVLVALAGDPVVDPGHVLSQLGVSAQGASIVSNDMTGTGVLMSFMEPKVSMLKSSLEIQRLILANLLPHLLATCATQVE